MKKIIALVSALAASGFAFGQAAPVYTTPTNRVSAALAEGIMETLVRRGFAANDPRVFQTIEAVSARTLTTAAAAGAGSSWIAVAGRLSPWVAGALAVYEGYKWIFGTDGTVTTQATIKQNAVAGITYGGAYWVSGVVAGSDPYSVGYQAALPGAGTGWYYDKFSFNSSSSTSTRQAYSYSYAHPTYCPKGGCQASTVYVDYKATGAPGTCTSGSYYKIGSGCSAYSFGEIIKTTTGQTYQQAYDALPQAAKDAAANKEVLAEILNRLWLDASSQSGYSGVPFASSAPVQSTSFDGFQAAHPTDFPSLSDVGGKPVPSSGAIVSPETNPNQTNSTSGGTKLDLGPDPGIPAPNLEEPPQDIFKPVKDLLSGWLAWQPPQHSSQCPTWSASPAIGGHVFSIDVSYHCQFAESYRAAIHAAALVSWAVIAAFIVLSA